MIGVEQIKELEERLAQLKRCLKIDEKRGEAEEMTKRTLEADFWNDAKEAEAFQKKLAGVKSWLESYDKAESSLEDLKVLLEFGDSDENLNAAFTESNKKIEELELKNMLSGEGDNLGAVLTINSGAGGTEANDWSGMLMRMYLRWCERNGYKTTVRELVEGEETGIKNVTIEVDGDYAYGYLKAENGVHRLVRISPFNAQGKRQTTFSSVFIYPLVDDSINIEINPADLEWDTYRSSGAGGQHVNKTESAIRITHIPTGIVVSCQTQRSQVQNREQAMMMLKSKLAELKEREQMEEAMAIKGEIKKIEWGSQIRSYVFCPYTLVKDHRTGFENANIVDVMDGNIQPFIEDYLEKAL